MRKIEHIHTHALLAEVTRFLIVNETMPAENLSGYEALGTRPTSIHEPKQNHHEAIMMLGGAIELYLEESRTDNHERTVNR